MARAPPLFFPPAASPQGGFSDNATRVYLRCGIVRMRGIAKFSGLEPFPFAMTTARGEVNRKAGPSHSPEATPSERRPRAGCGERSNLVESGRLPGESRCEARLWHVMLEGRPPPAPFSQSRAVSCSPAGRLKLAAPAAVRRRNAGPRRAGASAGGNSERLSSSGFLIRDSKQATSLESSPRTTTEPASLPSPQWSPRCLSSRSGDLLPSALPAPGLLR